MQLTKQLRDSKRYLTTTEVMELLSLRRNTLCSWIKTGRMPAILTGNGYRFDPMELADWIDARHTSAVSRLRDRNKAVLS